MRRLRTPFLIALASAALAACGGEEKKAGTASMQPPSSTTTKEAPAEKKFGLPTNVPADANIFGAGSETPPAPGEGGAGVAPPVWRLAPGSDRFVTFPSVTGRVNAISFQNVWNGAAGDDRRGPTDIGSWGGISGIVDRRHGMFLTGVFLTDAPPSDPAPDRLDFSKREKVDLLEPELGQTFYVGDGRGVRFRVPIGATRLFLGFADAFNYQGLPGWYGNNAGTLDVSVEVARG